MDAQSSENIEALRSTALQIGFLRLPGIATYLFRFAIFVLLTALIAYTRPHSGTVATEALWLAFSIYWVIAG